MKRKIKARNSQPNPMTIEQIEERLTNTILASSLALKVLKGIRKPTSQLIQELLEIEFQVGHFIGEALKTHVEEKRTLNLKGVLANALSTIPLGGPCAAMPDTGSLKAVSKPRKRKKPKVPRTKR